MLPVLVSGRRGLKEVFLLLNKCLRLDGRNHHAVWLLWVFLLKIQEFIYLTNYF